MKDFMRNYSLDLATQTKSGLFIARSDFYLPEDVTLEDGTIFRQGKKYFTLSEIDALKALKSPHTVIPCGWDVPSYKELREIAAEFSVRDGNHHSHHLMTSLGLGLYGNIIGESLYVHYNADPQNGLCYVDGYNVSGCYLGRSALSPDIPCALYMYGGNDNIVVSKQCNPSANATVRLVFRSLS